MRDAANRPMNVVDQNSGTNETVLPRRPIMLTTEDYVAGVLAGDRTILSRAITLIESNARADEAQAQDVLQRLLPQTGKARRIGITGVPGVGKSTFIEAFGCHLVGLGQKVAVLAIDPSSKYSGGSVLGDKTRMERLSCEPQAFIRPSPAGDSLGGVARRTRETMLLCEAAGFDTIIVETMGAGQAEIALRSMVDFFLLLLLPGAGDELQSIKKGIMEMADAVLINKADGDNRLRAEQARQEQDAALHYLQVATRDWKPVAALSSGRTGEGITEIRVVIERFYGELRPKGVISKRRQEQMLDWLSDLVGEGLRRRFYDDPRIQGQLPKMQQALINYKLTPVRAAEILLEAHDGCARTVQAGDIEKDEV